MSAYTCIACRVVFVDGVTQRSHYKTDWHRYNLKRKVADLPPVTADNFKQRVLNAQQNEATEDKSNMQCLLCGKHFNTQGALQNHLQSKKHKEAEAKEARKVSKEVEKMNEKNEGKSDEVVQKTKKHVEKDLVNQALKEQMSTATAGAVGGRQGPMEEEADTDSDVESVDSFGDEEGLGLEECLFCSQVSKSLDINLEHMTLKHGFFIPDVEFLTELEGLITYLGQKVAIGHMCMWCNEKGKGFHSTKSVQQHMMDKGHCKMLHEGDVFIEYADFYDYRSSYPDFDPSAAREGEEETEDMEVDESKMDLDGDGFELVLPSGATIGHRSLQKYYKQNINPRSEERTRSVLPRMLAQYKALGWTGVTGSVAQKRAKDLGAVQRMKNKFRMKIGMKANKFQPHFREQVNF